MILMLPFLLMTLHFSQIGFTDDLTFMSNLLSKKTVLDYSMQARQLQGIFRFFPGFFRMFSADTFSYGLRSKCTDLAELLRIPSSAVRKRPGGGAARARMLSYLSLQMMRPLERS